MAAVDLNWTEREQAFRAEARAWLEANVPRPALPSGDTPEGFELHRVWEKKLFDARWAVVSWPKEYGGREATLFEWLIFEEEYYRAGAPQRVTQNGIFLLAPTVFEYGTKAQKDRILLRMAEGLESLGQGWSEPNAGSDLASIRAGPCVTRPREAGDSPARRRGPPAAPTATGCSASSAPTPPPSATRDEYFLVPLRTPGVTSAQLAGSTATRASPKCSSKTCSSRTTTSSEA